LNWTKTIEAEGIEKLKNNLLAKIESKETIKVNFDPSLTRLLKEIR